MRNLFCIVLFALAACSPWSLGTQYTPTPVPSAPSFAPRIIAPLDVFASWSVPKVRVTVAPPWNCLPCVTVAENVPSNPAFGDTGCQAWDNTDKGWNAPHRFMPIENVDCPSQHSEIWVSMQPWNNIITCRLVVQGMAITMLQGDINPKTGKSDTNCTLTKDGDGAYDFVYDLVQQSVAS